MRITRTLTIALLAGTPSAPAAASIFLQRKMTRLRMSPPTGSTIRDSISSTKEGSDRSGLRNSRKSTVNIRTRAGAQIPIMTSYAYYQAGEYDDCVNSAKRYITLHPGGADAAYAHFLIGSSYFDEIPDITRDQRKSPR